MTLPRWKKLLENSLDVSSNIPESRFFQVANVTVSKYSNEPIANNRTMVFRGFTLRDNFLLAICDNRSTKYKQWQQQPKSNICWYFTKSREQYRIANTIELLGNDSNQNYNDNQNIRKNVWNNLTEKAKSQFLSARPKPSLDNYQNEIITMNEDIPETFIVIAFKPNSIDYLNIYKEPHIRELHNVQTLTNIWEHKAVHP